jgi:hypothetical protein
VIAQKEERLSRIERWLYQGLHSLDLPYLYQSYLAWQFVVVGLSLGGAALSLTAVWLTWKRTRRVARRSTAWRVPSMTPRLPWLPKGLQRSDGAGRTQTGHPSNVEGGTSPSSISVQSSSS